MAMRQVIAIVNKAFASLVGTSCPYSFKSTDPSSFAAAKGASFHNRIIALGVGDTRPLYSSRPSGERNMYYFFINKAADSRQAPSKGQPGRGNCTSIFYFFPIFKRFLFIVI